MRAPSLRPASTRRTASRTRTPLTAAAAAAQRITSSGRRMPRKQSRSAAPGCRAWAGAYSGRQAGPARWYKELTRGRQVERILMGRGCDAVFLPRLSVHSPVYPSFCPSVHLSSVRTHIRRPVRQRLRRRPSVRLSVCRPSGNTSTARSAAPPPPSVCLSVCPDAHQTARSAAPPPPPPAGQSEAALHPSGCDRPSDAPPSSRSRHLRAPQTVVLDIQAHASLRPCSTTRARVGCWIDSEVCRHCPPAVRPPSVCLSTHLSSVCVCLSVRLPALPSVGLSVHCVAMVIAPPHPTSAIMKALVLEISQVMTPLIQCTR
jgi:hypothetical protein